MGRPHVSEDVARLSAVRDAVGPGFDIMVDANQGFNRPEALRRAGVDAVVSPRRMDSEGLLALPELRALRDLGHGAREPAPGLVA